MSFPNPNPQIIDYVPYFGDLITIQEDAIASFKKWAGGFVLVSLMVVVFALMMYQRIPGVASQIVGIGGVFMGVLSAFPYREIAPRKSRIVTLTLLKRGFETFQDLSEEDRKRLRDLADETIKRQI
jgi:hypothetical protein